MWWLAGAVLAILCLFLSKLFGKNLVIITSVVHTSSKPLSYAQRSALTHEQRFEQTIESVRSVLRRVPNPYIVIVEGSALSSHERAALLSAGCDEIIDCSADLREHIDGPHKSPAEARMILYALDRIYPRGFSTASKLSGRYRLTENFRWHAHPLGNALYQCESERNCNTRYYRIPAEFLATYRKTLEDALRDESFLSGKTDIENYNIFRNFPSHSRLMRGSAVLGVKGYIAPWNRVVEDFALRRS